MRHHVLLTVLLVGALVLSLLTLVRFDHFTCNSSTGENGTCYTQRECDQMGGVAGGPCADGYGVCCVFTKTCGERITMNNTYFVNEDYPGSYDATSSCQVTIDKVHDNICQFRLDFDTFSIAQPEPNNNICMNDQFSVSGSSSMPLICGYSTGNHMYVDASGGGSASPTTLNIVTSGPSFARSWKIRVSQIPCGTAYTGHGNWRVHLPVRTLHPSTERPIATSPPRRLCPAQEKSQRPRRTTTEPSGPERIDTDRAGRPSRRSFLRQPRLQRTGGARPPRLRERAGKNSSSPGHRAAPGSRGDGRRAD